MGRAAVGGLLVPPGCAVALRASAETNRRFHDRIGMPIPHHHGHPRVCLGKVGSARAGCMAISISKIRSPLGAACFEKTHPSLGSARHESIGREPEIPVEPAYFLGHHGTFGLTSKSPLCTCIEPLLDLNLRRMNKFTGSSYIANINMETTQVMTS